MTTQNERLRALFVEVWNWMINDTCRDCEYGGRELRKRIDAALAEPEDLVYTQDDVNRMTDEMILIRKAVERERDEARAQRDESDSDAHLAETQFREIVELVGEGGDGSAFGSVESMLTTHKHVQEILQQQLDEARAEIERLRKVMDERWYECHDGSEESCCKNH